MRKFVRLIDPKLERFRTPGASALRSRSDSQAKPDTKSKADSQPAPEPPAPQSLSDFIALIKRTPRTVLSGTDRTRIAAIMSFDDRRVADLMVSKSQMVFVRDTEILGPLVLDKLYKSGFTNFPVVDYQQKVLGIIHTEALNALEIKETDRATKYLDPTVCYLHLDDSLQDAVNEIERTNSYYFLVLGTDDTLTGFFTVQMLLDYLLG